MGYTHTMPVSTTPDQPYSTDVPSGSTWPEATYRSTSYDPTDNILKFRIQNLFRGDVQGTWKRWMAGVSVRYNSHVRNLDKIFVDLDTSPPPLQLQTGVEGWMETHRSGDTLVDVRLGYDLSDEVRIAALVNNLTNEVYALRPLSIESPRNVQVQLTMDL
jgi:outer membrane receptor protein involved in Fe transport